jgi:hypothetical protein
MNQDTAIAANRFGLGVKPGSLTSADPRKALLSEMESYEPRPAALAAMPPRAELAAALRDIRMARTDERKAKAPPEMAMPRETDPERNEYRRAIRDHFSDAVEARL